MTLLEIYTSMLELKDRAGDSPFTVAEFTKILRGIIGTDGIRVSSKRSNKVDLNQVVVCGLYSPHEDEAGRIAIDVFVTYNPEQKFIRMSEIGWKRLCIDMIECSGHEIIHQRQFRERNFDINSSMFVSGEEEDENLRREQEYLANPDEIDAYGYSIAVELFLKKYPEKIKSSDVSKIPTFKAYSTTFGKKHPVVKQLMTHMLGYYAQMTSAHTNINTDTEATNYGRRQV